MSQNHIVLNHSAFDSELIVKSTAGALLFFPYSISSSIYALHRQKLFTNIQSQLFVDSTHCHFISQQIRLNGDHARIKQIASLLDFTWQVF